MKLVFDHFGERVEVNCSDCYCSYCAFDNQDESRSSDSDGATELLARWLSEGGQETSKAKASNCGLLAAAQVAMPVNGRKFVHLCRTFGVFLPSHPIGGFWVPLNREVAGIVGIKSE